MSFRVAVVGAGRMGKLHARVLSEMPQAELVCVVDTNAGKGRLASTPGSHGRARLSPGKVIDSLNYDVAALRSQGVKLEEIRDEDEAA